MSRKNIPEEMLMRVFKVAELLASYESANQIKQTPKKISKVCMDQHIKQRPKT